MLVDLRLGQRHDRPALPHVAQHEFVRRLLNEQPRNRLAVGGLDHNRLKTLLDDLGRFENRLDDRFGGDGLVGLRQIRPEGDEVGSVDGLTGSLPHGVALRTREERLMKQNRPAPRIAFRASRLRQRSRSLAGQLLLKRRLPATDTRQPRNQCQTTQHTAQQHREALTHLMAPPCAKHGSRVSRPHPAVASGFFSGGFGRMTPDCTSFTTSARITGSAVFST